MADLQIEQIFTLQGSLSSPRNPNPVVRPTENGGLQTRQAQPGRARALESLLGPDARAQRVLKLNASERPFAAGQGVKAWLDEASTPLQRSEAAPSSIVYESSEEYSPSKREINAYTDFDQAAEEQTRQYLASLSTGRSGPPRPFAADEGARAWREEVSAPQGKSSNLYMAPQGTAPAQKDPTAYQNFDSLAEEQTRQYLDRLSRAEGQTQKPFAAGGGSQSWLEAAIIPMGDSSVDPRDESASRTVKVSFSLSSVQYLRILLAVA